MSAPTGRLRWSAALVAAALLVGGCSVRVPGAATAAQPEAPTSVAPTPDTPPSAAAPSEDASPTSRPPRPDASQGGCRISLTGRGSISMSGSGGRAVTRNGATSFSCSRGPLVAIVAVTAGGVRFSADGTEVEVAEGATEAVGPYRITTVEVDGDAAQFDVVPAG